MALKYADRVEETSTTTGTGDYSLTPSSDVSKQTFVAGIGDTHQCFYCATDGTDYEIGYGTVTDGTPDTLTRTKVRQSSNSDNAVSWAAGTRTIFCTIPAHMAIGGMPGTIIESGVTSAPFGYVALGSDLLRTDYPELFDAIGTGYGASDGTHFYAGLSKAGRVTVGAGTGTVAETQAAANFATTDIITVTSNPMNTKPKWLTGMKVQVTTDGTLPTGISAATDYWVRRLSATTISLYTSFAAAMDRNAVTGRVNITATGSGNHTLTCTMTARGLADTFGAELTADVPAHIHSGSLTTSTAGAGIPAVTSSDDSVSPLFTGSTGDPDGVTNMPPSIVSHFYMKY